MNSSQKTVFWILLAISLLYFTLFILPNNTGADDQMMISLFETDEFAQYPVVMKMLTPRAALDKTLLNFIEYRHYYYGSPFYFSSALLLLPVKAVAGLGNTQLNMLLLRQFISVLPMLAALLLLTFVQTKFKSPARSILLFVFLLSVSAVVENNLWWHVDSLAVFFIALTFFFLEMDDLRYGRYFHLAAVSTGLATGTKVIGLFFFLAIPTYLLIGILRRQLSLPSAFFRGMAFVSLMAAAILISNPFMFLPGEFTRMTNLLTRQSASMSAGWVLFYAKGPASWLPILDALYGNLIFIILALIALGIGIWRAETRVRHLLVAMWAIPFGLYVLFQIAIKPTHFFLPILLPLYGCLAVLFELGGLKINSPGRTLPGVWLIRGLVLAVVIFQFVVYMRKDIQLYSEVRTREENEGSLVFYDVLASEYLPRLLPDDRLVVFRDVRMYFAEDPRWIVRTYWNSSYKTIEKIKPDLIVLWSQRILDYTQEGARENAVNPESFEDTYEFYVDADNDRLRGYRLIYRDEEGLFFATEAIYPRFFE